MKKKKTKVIKRGNITYVIRPDSVVVGVGFNQWISYNPYVNWNKQGISEFTKAILKSKEDEYTTAAEQMHLSSECGIKGTSTHKPEEVE